MQRRCGIGVHWAGDAAMLRAPFVISNPAELNGAPAIARDWELKPGDGLTTSTVLRDRR
jgi:hypothetical protein